MDSDLRQLERKAQNGDPEAAQRLHASRIRHGLSSDYRQTLSGGKVVTNLVGTRVWKHDRPSFGTSDNAIVGTIVAVYSPDIAAAASSINTASQRGYIDVRQGVLHFLVETEDGSFVDAPVTKWNTFNHPESPKS